MTVNRQYKGLDLFSGIGGFTLAMLENGIQPIAYSEIDQHALATYKANFNHDALALGDITKVESKTIPPYDLLTGGFPCQAFSMLGHRRGFEDARGTLFFSLAKLIAETRPRWFLLENVRGLVYHDQGRTIHTIVNLLGNVHNGQELLPCYIDHLGYTLDFRVLNAKDYGLPQSRERIFIVGRRYTEDRFVWPSSLPPVKLETVLDLEPDPYCYFTEAEYERWKGYYAKSHFAGECFESVPETCPTITAGYNKTKGNAIKFKDATGRYRILTVRECLRCQGYPETFRPDTNRNQAYKQVGNSIPVRVASLIIKALREGASQ